MDQALVVKYPLALMAVFVWVGFVCAISFMEAWLKFRAPGINLHLGLGIGRLVFSALNKVEWVMALIIFLNYFLGSGKDFQWIYVLFLLAFVILVTQTFYFLPVMDARAELHIQGAEVPPSKLHFVYVFIELVKVISLIVFGVKLLN